MVDAFFRLMRQNIRVLPLAALFAVLWFATIGTRALIDPDEGRYAEIARGMATTGDWVVPRLNGIVYLEKPPLQYWITAAAYTAFGAHQWTARLWPACAGLLAVAMLWGFARRRWGEDAAALAALSLASGGLWFGYAQTVTLDMGLTCWLTAALLSFATLAERSAQRRATGAAAALLWIALALAVLSKGFVALALPLLALLAWMAWSRRTDVLRPAFSPLGIALFVAIVAPWHLLMLARVDGFFDTYIVHEHFQRFLEPGHRRQAPWWSVSVVVLIGALPWTWLQLRGLAAGWRAVRAAPAASVAGADGAPAAGTHAVAARADADTLRLMLVWAATVIGFFSLSSSKLPGYVLPALPALALLAGAALRCGVRTRGALPRVALWLPLGATAIGMVALGLSVDGWTRRFLVDGTTLHGLTTMLLSAGAVSALAAAAIAFVRSRWLLPIAGLSTLATLQLALVGIDQVSDAVSARTLAHRALAAEEVGDPQVPFYAVSTWDHTLPVYLGRTLVLVGYEDEFGPGIRREPAFAIRDVEDFRLRWRALPRGYAVMDRVTFERERAAGLPMREVATDGHRVVVARAERSAPAVGNDIANRKRKPKLRVG